MTSSTWSSETVLITGSTGFKGSWLSLWLSNLGAKVIGYSLAPPSHPSFFDVLGIGTLTENIEADVRDLERLRSVMGRVRPTIVMHLAAQALVRASYADPVETYGSNLMGTVNVLEAVRSVESVRAVVVVTSDKCYRNDAGRAHSETDALGGNDPYSDSKACAELATACMRRAFFDNGAIVATARAGNVIGGGDWSADRIVPDVVRACYGSKPLSLRYPDAIRPWQHVLEALHGYLILAERASSGDRSVAQAWNFGPSPTRAVRVRELVGAIADRIGAELEIEIDERPTPAESPALSLDCSKAERELGWQAKLAFEDVVNYTGDWYRAYYEGANMRDVSCDQLATFTK